MSSPTNRGAIALKLKTSKRGEKAKLAKALDVGADVVSHWLTADYRPDTKSRARMEDDLRISWRWWDEDLADDEAVKRVTDELTEEFAEMAAAAEDAEPDFDDAPPLNGTDHS